jgi:hypothetical protein
MAEIKRKLEIQWENSFACHVGFHNFLMLLASCAIDEEQKQCAYSNWPSL